MKTIFRYANFGILLAAIFAVGAVAQPAQNPCEDADGMSKLGDEVRAQFAVKTLEGRKTFANTGKQFLEKFGACDPAKDLSDWLKVQLPKTDDAIKRMEAEAAEGKLIARFDAALKGKNWDDVYAAGKEILANYPEKYRTAEIVLGSVGGEEAFKGNFKYADDAIRFAKQSIADLEGGKSFVLGKGERFGLSEGTLYNFEYKSRDEAKGWLNLYIGYLTYVGKKDKAGALPYLFKSTQAASDSAKQSVAFELIGGYYFDELNKLVEEIQKLMADQKDSDPEDVAKQKIETIKAKVALNNGTAERAMDAFSRAYTFAKDPALKARLKKNVQDAYKVRFAKEDGVDAWIASAVTKPFVNPQTPIAPISDPEPTKTEAATTAPAASPAAKPAGPIKPAPATRPGSK